MRTSTLFERNRGDHLGYTTFERSNNANFFLVAYSVVLEDEEELFTRPETARMKGRDAHASVSFIIDDPRGREPTVRGGLKTAFHDDQIRFKEDMEPIAEALVEASIDVFEDFADQAERKYQEEVGGLELTGIRFGMQGSNWTPRLDEYIADQFDLKWGGGIDQTRPPGFFMRLFNVTDAGLLARYPRGPLVL
jgi:hypothetical protein